MPLVDEMDLANVEKLILEGAADLLNHDQHLFECDANERSITHKFAEHLQRRFFDWDVDCEYSRDRHDVKRLALGSRNIKSDDVNATTVYPDTIIHRRGTSDNLAVIEVKKSANAGGEDRDMEKLKSFKDQLGYRVALFFSFVTGCHQSS